MDIKYNLTYHALERLQERFGAFCSEVPILKNWKREQGLKALKPLFNDMLEMAEENKSYLNNSAYMIKTYEKYGYDNEYCFLELKEKNILFLLTKKRSDQDYTLVTLMPMDYRPSVKNVKYAGKEHKKMCFNKFLMDWSKYDLTLNKPNMPPIVKKLNLVCQKHNKKPKVEVATLPSVPVHKHMSHEVVLDTETQLLHKKLIASIGKSEAIQIERISNSKAIYAMTFDNIEYEFTYSKTASGVKTLVINNVKQLSNEEQENIENGFRELYPKTALYQTILKLIKNNEVTLDSQLDNGSKLYKVSLSNQLYNVTYIENSSDQPKLVIRTKNNTNVMVKVKADHDELKTSGVSLDKNDDLYKKLIEAVNNENFRLIEKYSVTTSLRVTTLDKVDYQYVYIKRNNKQKDREIILQNPEVVANKTVYNHIQALNLEMRKNVENNTAMKLGR